MYSSIFFQLLLSLFISFAWAPLLIHLLYKLNIVRKINTDFSTIVDDRYLKAGTPIMGGLLIIITTVVLTLLMNRNPDTIVALIVFVSIALLGGIDDVMNIFGHKRNIRTVKRQLQIAKVHKNILFRIWLIITLPWCFFINLFYALGSFPGSGIQAGEKIIVQILAGGAVAWWVYVIKGISTIQIPLLGTFNLGILLPLLIIIVVITMSNAVNIADGMDGLSSGLLIFSFLALFIIAILEKDWGHATIHAVVIGSLLSYLYFNIKPARFQMGNVGALSLGTLLATTAIFQGKIVILPIIGMVFVAEITSSLIQGIYRRFYGKRLFKMAPLHMHFQLLGWTEEKVVMRLWLFGLIMAFIGIWINFV